MKNQQGQGAPTVTSPPRPSLLQTPHRHSSRGAPAGRAGPGCRRQGAPEGGARRGGARGRHLPGPGTRAPGRGAQVPGRGGPRVHGRGQGGSQGAEGTRWAVPVFPARDMPGRGGCPCARGGGCHPCGCPCVHAGAVRCPGAGCARLGGRGEPGGQGPGWGAGGRCPRVRAWAVIGSRWRVPMLGGMLPGWGCPGVHALESTTGTGGAVCMRLVGTLPGGAHVHRSSGGMTLQWGCLCVHIWGVSSGGT